MGILDAISEAKESRRLEKERKMHEKFMQLALKEANRACELKEVPIGCVIVRNGSVIAKGYNRRNTDRNVLNHAELDAIRTACKKVKDWRLEDCDIYITLEPCPMCAGAIVQARIPRVIIGSMNPKAGCAGSVVNLLDMPGFNHRCEVVRGILEDECSGLLSGFFRELRAEHADNGEPEATSGDTGCPSSADTASEPADAAEPADMSYPANASEPAETAASCDDTLRDESADELWESDESEAPDLPEAPSDAAPAGDDEYPDQIDPIEAEFDEALESELSDKTPQP